MEFVADQRSDARLFDGRKFRALIIQVLVDKNGKVVHLKVPPAGFVIYV